jgi:hypothetical protein
MASADPVAKSRVRECKLRRATFRSSGLILGALSSDRSYTLSRYAIVIGKSVLCAVVVHLRGATLAMAHCRTRCRHERGAQRGVVVEFVLAATSDYGCGGIAETGCSKQNC